MSMDEVLQKLYQGKLEHRDTDMVETLPPHRRVDRLALIAATSVPLTVEGSSASSEESPLAP